MKLVLLAVTVLLAGCTSAPTRWEPQPWASKVFEQASAECYEDIQKDTSSGSYVLCMRARGWFEVRSR